MTQVSVNIHAEVQDLHRKITEDFCYDGLSMRDYFKRYYILWALEKIDYREMFK